MSQPSSDSPTLDPRRQEEILTGIFQAINPSEPVPPDSPTYVECDAERGDTSVIDELAMEILRGEEKSCQLYSGHRGAGKSTELLRLKQYLEAHGCFVVYFAAVGDSEDVDPEDAEYTDILFSCTRHLLEQLRLADPQPILSWFKERWQALKDMGLTRVEADDLSIDVGIQEMANLSTTIRAVPSERQKVRNLINPDTPSLLSALNDFIVDSRNKLPPDKSKLVVIVDNLDRIVPVRREGDDRSNHDEIFLERSGQLRGLHCHLIYTVPISMVHSNRRSDLQSAYGCNIRLLPMVMVRTRTGDIRPDGLEVMKKLIRCRIHTVVPNASLETSIFETAEALEQLCLMSGGHMRELFVLLKEAVNRTKTLPIPVQAIRRAITETRATYRSVPQANQWALLAQVAKTHQIENESSYRELLFRRCILEYRYLDEEGEVYPWYDVHPLMRGMAEFKQELSP